MEIYFGPAEEGAARRLIRVGFEEDLGDQGDLTSEILIDPEAKGAVDVVARDAGILCGVPIGRLALAALEDACAWTDFCEDGQSIDAGQCLAKLSGSVRSLLTAERTILNFMTHLSGVASLTRMFVDLVAGTPAVILDTRKTLPGWRVLQKYAVRCGGGTNHRKGLWDAILIKDNHLAACPDASLSDIIGRARQNRPEGVVIEVEVDSLDQLTDALSASPDVILLDNMNPLMLAEAVEMRNRRSPGILLEASGGVRLESVADIARSGVDRISVGMLTHSAPALDLGFDWHL